MYCTPHSDIQKLLQTKEEQEIRKFVREMGAGTLERSKRICLQWVGALNPSLEDDKKQFIFSKIRLYGDYAAPQDCVSPESKMRGRRIYCKGTASGERFLSKHSKPVCLNLFVC